MDQHLATGNAPGAQLTVYIPILRSVVVQNEIATAGLVGPIHFRIWWRGPTWQNPGTVQPPLTVSSFQALAQTTVWDPSRGTQITNRMMTGPRQDIRYAAPGFQRTVENLVGGQPFTLRLSGISGLITSMTLLVRNLATSRYVPMMGKNVDLLDPAGSSILGGTPIDSNYTSLVYSATQPVHFDPTSFWQFAYRVPISGPNVAHAEMRGHVEAFIPMSGSHQLRFTPSLDGAYQVSVITYSVSMLSIERGQLSVDTA